MRQTYKDDRVLADIDLPADEVRAHVCNDNPLILLITTLRLQRVRELLELDTIDCFIVAEVDKGGTLTTLTFGRGQRPRLLRRDGTELAIIGLARVKGNIDVLRSNQPRSFLRRLQRPASSNEVVKLQFLLDLFLDSLED